MLILKLWVQGQPVLQNKISSKRKKKEKNEHLILIWDWQWQSSKMHNTQSIETIIISGKITMLSQIIL